MPKTRDDPQLIEAIEMTAQGMSARLAWEQCGRPNGEKGIQNVRKAGKRLAEQRAAEAAPESQPEAASVGPGKGHAQAGFRLRSDQVQRQLSIKRAAREEWDKIYCEATAKWAHLYQNGETGKIGRAHV